MASHIISRRIQFIIQYIYDDHYPSKVDLINFLTEKDFKVSPRTLERDIDRIRTDFGLEIVYNKSNQGYFIDKSKSVKVDSFFKFLEIVTVADILSESLKDSNTILDFVSFDDSKNFKGIENLKIILAAISQNRKLQFVHENFWRATLKEYVITPLLLKEYENRWYVIGVPEGMNEIRTFGIDRITELTLSTLSNVKKNQFKNQLKNFDDIIGLDFNQGKPTNIRLLVDGIHIKYMKSLPLHHSQNIHTENENGEFFVDFFLSPNYEFTTQILKIGNEVEVLYPPELRDEIKNTLTKTLNKYQ